MKILYIVPYVPNLIRVRPYNLIRYLLRLGHEVTIATILSDPIEQTDVLSLRKTGAHVFTIQMPTLRSLSNSLISLAQRVPMQSRYSWHPELFEQIIALLELQQKDSRFDVIHVEHLRGIEYGLHLLAWQQYQNGLRKIPVVWDSVDCISYLMRQTGQRGSSMKSRLIASLEVKSTSEYERRGVGLFDRVLVTSPVDRMELLKVCDSKKDGKKIDVLQNGVDLNYFTPSDIDRDSDTIVVSGKMSYHANEAMVKYLVNEIMPLVWVDKPTVRLQIVGKDPPRSIQAMAENTKITVTGTVPDIRPYLQQATLAVVATIYGAGIQNKILEAMACATPVVVSTKAASALMAIPNRDFLIAETTQQFSEAILDLLDNSQKRHELGKAGRMYVEKNHDWTQIAARLLTIYESAIEFKKNGVVEESRCVTV